MDFSQPSIYSYGLTPFCNNKMNLKFLLEILKSCFENLYLLANLFSKCHQSFFFLSVCFFFLLQHKHLYTINSYSINSYLMLFVYSRKHSQYLYLTSHVLHFLLSCLRLHLTFWISSSRLSTIFDNELAINSAISEFCCYF